ncbi:MAG TPA: DUF1259 domain-containing protein [Tepidisphaeraceae bacterium]|jgi:hypothetical protein
MLLVLLFIPRAAQAQSTRPTVLPVQKMQFVLHATGTLNATGRVLKFTFPRHDIHPTESSQPLPAPTSRVGFQVGHRKPAIVAAELVLLPHEVNPALAAAIETDLSVTALNTKHLDEHPRLHYLSIDAEGDPVLLALAIQKVFDARDRSQVTTRAIPTTIPSPSAIDPAPLNQIFSATGTLDRGVYSIDFPHKVELPCGCTVSTDMGVRSTATFTGAMSSASIRGELACIAGQLQPALKLMTAAQFQITAIQNHMELESPRTLYVTYQATGPATELAKTLKQATDLQKLRTE